MAISEFCKNGPSRALDRTLSVLDEPCKKAIAFHLRQRYAIDALSDPTPSQIEQAITDMLGEGADILISRFHTELLHDMITG